VQADIVVRTQFEDVAGTGAGADCSGAGCHLCAYICTIIGKLVKKLSDSFAKVAPPVLGAFDRT